MIESINTFNMWNLSVSIFFGLKLIKCCFKLTKMFTLGQYMYYKQIPIIVATTYLKCFIMSWKLFPDHIDVCIYGDFNARSAEVSDITITDDDILKQLGIDFEIIFSSDNTDILKKFDLDIKRVSKDKTVNMFGRNLVDFCLNNDTIILNGQAFADKGIGATTCKDKSVVDYVICTSSCISFLSSFEVKEFCPLFSDAHNRIEFSFKYRSVNNFDETKVETEGSHKRWEEPKRNLFIQNLDPVKIQEVSDKLSAITQPNEASINEVMSDIEIILKMSKLNTFAKKKQT